MNLKEIYEQFCWYSKRIQDLVESGKSFDRLEKSMIHFYIDEVKNKDLLEAMLKEYPELTFLLNGLNLRIQTYKRPIRKKPIYEK